VCLSVSVYLSVCVSIYLSVCQCLSVCPHEKKLGSHWTDFISVDFVDKLSRKFKFHSNLTCITGPSRED
jgi:hypothetical protein